MHMHMLINLTFAMIAIVTAIAVVARAAHRVRYAVKTSGLAGENSEGYRDRNHNAQGH